MPDRPKVAFIDIETSPILATIWKLHEADAVWVERDTFILCFAVLWAGEKQVKTYCLPDYPGYQHNKHDDSKLAKDLWGILHQADIVVAHNGDSFDIKKINARLAVNGYPPPAPFKTIDTLKLAKKTFRFDSNKLDNLGRYLGCGRKIPNTGAHLWRGCVEGDPHSWALMRKYNAQDVKLLQKVYERIKAWAPIHDFRSYANVDGCPTCLSQNIQRRGIAIKQKLRYQRFQCQDCGTWFSGARDAA